MRRVAQGAEARALGGRGKPVDWAWVYGRLYAGLGLSSSTVDAMSPEELDDVFAYWNASPPVNELVAAYLGVTPKTAQDSTPSSEEDVRAFAAALGAEV